MSISRPAYTLVHSSGEPCYVNAVAAHPQVPQLATAGDDGRLVCWDVARQTPTWERTLTAGGLFDVSYAGSGAELIAAGAGEAGVKCLRAADGKQLWSVARRGSGSAWGFSAAAIDPKQRVLVATPGDDMFVHVYALPSRSHTLNFTQASLRAVFSPDGRRVATAGEGAVKIWNPFGKRAGSRLYLPPVWRLEVGDAVVSDVAFAPDGVTCATASSDGVLRVWPVKPGQGRPRPSRELHLDAAPLAVGYSPDGRWLTVGDELGRVTWLAPTELRALETHQAHAGRVGRVTFSPSAAWLVTAGGDGVVSLWAPPS